MYTGCIYQILGYAGIPVSTPTVIYCDQNSCVIKLFNLESGLCCVQVRCISNKIWTQITPFFICSVRLCVKVLEKIIARTLGFMHQGIFGPNYIFNNNVYFLDFHAQNSL